jgi:hypothetical protein
MQQTSQISFDINTSDHTAEIAVSVFIDNSCIFKTLHYQWAQKIQFSIPDDDEGEHELRIEISGKNANHTTIDSEGNILKDVVIQLSNFNMDDIDINQLFLEKTVYTHDFNGTTDTIEDQFFGVAGCNGVISFKFSTPIYLWLLENM